MLQCRAIQSESVAERAGASWGWNLPGGHVPEEVFVGGNLILCRTRLEEAERCLRDLIASNPSEREVNLKAAEALAHVWKALELLHAAETPESQPR